MDPLPDFPLLLPAAHPPIHLRHLDPSHSKILGTPLEGVNIFLKIKNFWMHSWKRTYVEN